MVMFFETPVLPACEEWNENGQCYVTLEEYNEGLAITIVIGVWFLM
jgi:hypothetical protein